MEDLKKVQEFFSKQVNEVETKISEPNLIKTSLLENYLFSMNANIHLFMESFPTRRHH